MFPTRDISARNTAKSIPPRLTIPASQPYNPVFPDSTSLHPTAPTPKIIARVPTEFVARPQVPEREVEVRSAPRGELAKRSAASPPRVEVDTNEIDQLKREIARLRGEIQHLIDERNALIHDYEDRIRALQRPDHNTEELQHRIAMLEDERRHLLDEINKLRSAKLALENGLLREREDMNRIIDGLKHHIEELEAANRGTMGLHGDLETLRNLLAQKDREIAMRDAEHNRLLIELNQLKGRSGNDLAMIMFMIEIERLHSLLAERGQEIEQLMTNHRLELSQLERKIREGFMMEKSQMEMELMRVSTRLHEFEGKVDLGEIARLKSENERLNALNRQLKEENDRRIQELTIEINRVRERPDMQQQLALLKTEVDRLNHALMIKSQEVDSWQQKYSRLETAKFEEIQMIISQNAEMAKRLSMMDSDKVLRMFKDLEGEHTALRTKYHAIAQELEHMHETRNSHIGPVDESPKKTILKQTVMTKIHNIGSETNQFGTTGNLRGSAADPHFNTMEFRSTVSPGEKAKSSLNPAMSHYGTTVDHQYRSTLSPGNQYNSNAELYRSTVNPADQYKSSVNPMTLSSNVELYRSDGEHYKSSVDPAVNPAVNPAVSHYGTVDPRESHTSTGDYQYYYGTTANNIDRPRVTATNPLAEFLGEIRFSSTTNDSYF